MRIVDIIGTVTLSQCHPSLQGLRWRLGTPLTLDGLRGDTAGREEPIVITDELGAGLGSRVAIAEGPEATAPYHPKQLPIDAYVAAILDQLDVPAAQP